MSRKISTMKQERNQREVENGVVMTSNAIFYFKFFGNYYTTNLKRKRGKYSLDDYTWKPDTSKGFWWKAGRVLFKEVRVLT